MKLHQDPANVFALAAKFSPSRGEVFAKRRRFGQPRRFATLSLKIRSRKIRRALARRSSHMNFEPLCWPRPGDAARRSRGTARGELPSKAPRLPTPGEDSHMMIVAAKECCLAHVVDARIEDYAHLEAQATDAGLRLAMFSSGRQALSHNDASPPDSWVVNLRLPDMSGADLMAMLRWRFPGADSARERRIRRASRDAGSREWAGYLSLETARSRLAIDADAGAVWPMSRQGPSAPPMEI